MMGTFLPWFRKLLAQGGKCQDSTPQQCRSTTIRARGNFAEARAHPLLGGVGQVFDGHIPASLQVKAHLPGLAFVGSHN